MPLEYAFTFLNGIISYSSCPSHILGNQYVKKSLIFHQVCHSHGCYLRQGLNLFLWPQWVEQHLMGGDNRFDLSKIKKKKKTTLGGSKFPINGGIQVKSGWPLGGDKVEGILEPCFAESGPRTRCISITWKLDTKAESQAPPKTYRIRICILARCPQ